MDLNEVEDTARAVLAPESGLSFSSKVDRGVLHLLINNSASRRSANSELRRETVELTTSGEEGFYLELDGIYFLPQFEYKPEWQADLIVKLIKLAEAYFNGQGHEQVRRGFFGRRHPELQIELDGENYIFHHFSER